ncbi:hypothetical protein [Anaerococcus vaginalis]|uniref:hypothetical protein n=1 Tax=Anaerococcus vaginalis TaxID=33037 RepID=UPI00290C3CC9|nr:hypothetical protein [Anaerococcus vaginalis]MDU5252077.1 hypothetical protein [Anaerococcus vaginalis]MDU6781706.1 hypothetical protein [Anaerococcus vaginalis]
MEKYKISNSIIGMILLIIRIIIWKIGSYNLNLIKYYIIIFIILLILKLFIDIKAKKSINLKNNMDFMRLKSLTHIILIFILIIYLKFIIRLINNCIKIEKVSEYIYLILIILFYFKLFDFIRKYILCISYKKLIIFGSLIFLAGIISINSWQIISLLFAFISLCINYDNYSSIYKYIFKETLIINSIRKQELKDKFAFMRIILAFLNLFIYILIILTQNSKINLAIYSFLSKVDINKFPNFVKIFFLGVDRFLIILFIYCLFVFRYKDKFKNILKKLMNSDSFLDFPFNLLFLN